MDKKDLKKFVAGFGIAGLLSGAGIAGVPGVAQGASG